MSACVSPPQESVSHMVEVAAIMAQAASTALPPFWKMAEPAVAASGLPVTAIQWAACSGGFWVCGRAGVAVAASSVATPHTQAARIVAGWGAFMRCLYLGRWACTAAWRQHRRGAGRTHAAAAD